MEPFHPRRVILFGSHARGDAQPDSELDLFVEMEAQARLPEGSVEISSAFGLRPWSTDVVVYTPEEVKRHSHFLAFDSTGGSKMFSQPP